MKGNPKAVLLLYERSYGRFFAICRQILRGYPEADTENILQNSYMEIFTSLDKLENLENFLAWGSTIVSNTALNFLRKNKRIIYMDMEDAQGGISIPDPEKPAVPDPAEIVNKQETEYLINRIIDRLPESQRICIFMYYMQDISVKEISERLGVTENTVKNRLRYGEFKIEEEVINLEKQGTKLYAMSPFVFFLWLYRGHTLDNRKHQLL